MHIVQSPNNCLSEIIFGYHSIVALRCLPKECMLSISLCGRIFSGDLDECIQWEMHKLVIVKLLITS